MATLSLAIIKSRPNKDGSYGIKIAVASQVPQLFISTRFKVENIKQWKGGKIVRHPDADVSNRKLRALLLGYENILDSMPNPNVSAVDVKSYLESRYCKFDSLKGYTEVYIARLEKREPRLVCSKHGLHSEKYLIECFGESMTLQQFTPSALMLFEKHLRKGGSSDTTINIRMSHLKALLNAAANDGTVEYKVFPFRNYKIPTKAVRDICISKEELRKLREAEFKGVSERRHTVARDLFMLSFYCAGINLTDLMDARA